MKENEFTIENERLKLQTRPRAAQMKSLIDKKTGYELLYQGDQGWADQNPSLFPIIGSTWKGGSYTINGKEYAMKNHGLVRYADLEGSSDGQKITYVMTSDEETKKQYPFDFRFEISYELKDNRVIVSYDITNTGNEPMPFSFGLHPAFRTSQNPDEKFEDFSIRFNRPLDCDQVIFTPDFDPVVKKHTDLQEWQLSREDLKKYGTLVFENPKADEAALCYKGEPRMSVHFKNYPWLALWSHPKESDMVCIEPWYGHADYEKKEQPFDKREGTMILQPHASFEVSYEIESI